MDLKCALQLVDLVNFIEYVVGSSKIATKVGLHSLTI